VFEFLIASRYLKTRLIAAISVLAIACAVVIAYVPNPVLEGFLTELKSKVRGTSADVLVETREDLDEDAVAKMAMAVDPRITHAAPRIEGTIIFATGDEVDGFDYGVLIGVVPEKEADVSHFGDYLENAGTSIDDPFVLKASTLKEILRREKAEETLGAEIVESLGEEARHEALDALGMKLGRRYYRDAAHLTENNVRKGYPPDLAKRLAERKVEEHREILHHELRARKGHGAFIRLEKDEASRRIDAVALAPTLEETPRFRSRLVEMRRRPGVLVGRSLLDNWRELRLGGEIQLVCGQFSGPFDAQTKPKGRNLLAYVVGVYDSGFYDFDVRTFYMDLTDAGEFLRGVRPVRGVGLRLKDWREAQAVREVLQPVFMPSGFIVTTWKQRKEVIIEAVKRQKQVLFVILFFADIVAGFGIFITLRILVAEKVSDIGIFASIGARPFKIMTAFVMTGLAIGLIGASIGVLVGIGIVNFSNEIVSALSWLGLTEFKSYIEEIQHLKRIPVEYRLWTLAKIILMTLISTLIFSLYPAFIAARMKPVDAIRREFL